MSSSANTVMVAKISVTSAGVSPTVVATAKVKTEAGIVIWRVKNNSGGDLENVKITNFSPAPGNPHDLRLQSGSFDDLDTGPISSGHSANIPALFEGDPGDIYNYEIWVDGHLASDPQLEI